MEVFNKLKNAVTNVLPGNPLSRDFDIHRQVASAGPGLLWKVFAATKKSTKEEASVFLLEKKAVERRSKREKELLIDSFRRGVQQLTKLRHPKILSVIHPLEETREALAYATEPIFSSLVNALGFYDNIQSPSTFLTEFKLYEVEIKHGMLQVLEGLSFLHNDAKILHRNVCPSSIILTKTGTWKLSGFDFCQQSTNPQDSNGVFSCTDWSMDIPPEAQPDLNFLAPEYEIIHSCSQASDMFSFGVLICALYNKGRPIQDCRGELSTFRKNTEDLSRLSATPLAQVPAEIRDHVKLLLNIEPTVRPDSLQLSKVPFFEDMACMALQYIDSLFQRENIEKSNFFKGLTKIIEKLPNRVNQQRILPALFKEGLNPSMIPFILPSIFLVAEKSTTEEYRSLILPSIIPYFKIKEPIQVMLMFLQNMNLLLSKTPAQQIQTHVFPLIFSALEADSPQIQELCLNIIPSFADLIEYNTLKKALVPRIKKLCLQTSVLTVRVNCLLCIGKLMDLMDKWYVLDEILPFLREIPTREPAVLMSILGIHKVALSESKLGITKDVMASKVLPFLFPLCIDNNLNLSQFNAFMSVVKEMTTKIETEHRTKLEQLEQIQQEHKTIEMTKLTGEPGSVESTGEKTFMDKFLTGVGLGYMTQTSTNRPISDAPKTVNGGSPIKNTSNGSGDHSVAPKKTNLTLEEKQRLAKQQEQERSLKAQKPINPQNQNPPSFQANSARTGLERSQPKDLTATLMESNAKNLSMKSSFNSSNNMGTPSSFNKSVNWSPHNQTHNPGMMSPMAQPQLGLSSGLSSTMSANNKPLDLSSFDSLLPNSGSARKTPMNQMGSIGTPVQQQTSYQAGVNWGSNMSSMPTQLSSNMNTMVGSGFHNQPTNNWNMASQQPGFGLMQPQSVQQSSVNSSNTNPLSQQDLKDFLG